MAREDIFAGTIKHFLAPVAQYLDDPSVSEIMINTFDEIYIEKDGELIRTTAEFDDENAFEILP